MIGRPPGPYDRAESRLSWEQLSPGYLTTIGKLGKRPVCVLVFFARIAGKVVAFYHATSEVVDHKMVEKWLWKKFSPPRWDNNTRRAHCDAQNFHHCRDALLGR